jgi:pimeloyl-ACP methyl ester carboxylesterase
MKKNLFLLFIVLFGLKAAAQNDLPAETPITYKNLSGTVSGTLTMPANATGKVPLVLIISDSGPTDRNGNNPQVDISGNSYKLLAQGLAKAGIASLRYDKRMVGESKTENKPDELRFEDYVDDAVGLIGLFSNDSRFSKIVMLGHGEGALVSMLAARDQPVKDVILVNPVTEQGDKIYTDIFKSKPQYLRDEFKTVLDSLKKGKTVDNVDLAMYPLVTTGRQKYLMSYFRYPPMRVIKVIKVPIVIIQGTTDLQSSVANAEKLKKSKSESVLITIPGMNHIMKEAPADEEQNVATYSKPELPLKAELIPDIVDFINKN